ncbi:hypothetical protein [Stenotrophomonas maltophilia]|uniref:hypothetical protein n=1 Tax=Stenotrophomonas maltophilia TaxID=40324 RepID=UPI003877844A
MAATIKRSPSYPTVPLSDSIERAKAFYKKEGKHETLVPTAASHWGYGPKSSGGLSIIAALKAYGLMGDRGNSADRKVFLTPFGLSIVQDERIVSPDRDAAIKRAALTPKIMSELWSRYQDNLPSKDTIYHFLKVEKEFNENAVADVLSIYLKNIEFARLSSQSQQENGEEEGESADENGSQGMPASLPPVPAPLMPQTPPPLVVTPAPAIATVSATGSVAVGSAYSGDEIANYRVSKSTTIRLLANGPYSRKSMEGLVKQIQLAIELGNFDDLPDEEEQS